MRHEDGWKSKTFCMPQRAVSTVGAKTWMTRSGINIRPSGFSQVTESLRTGRRDDALILILCQASARERITGTPG